jgi:hypothetical protein
VQASQLDFENFQAKVRKDRQAGLLFKTLYSDTDSQAGKRNKMVSKPATVCLDLVVWCSVYLLQIHTLVSRCSKQLQVCMNHEYTKLNFWIWTLHGMLCQKSCNTLSFVSTVLCPSTKHTTWAPPFGTSLRNVLCLICPFFPAYPFGLAYAALPAVLQVEAELLAQQEAQAHDHRVLRRYMTLTLGAISLGACAFGALPMFTSWA